MARPKSDISRVQTGLRLRPGIIKALRHMAIDRGCAFNVLVEEALEDYLHKLGVPIPPDSAAGEEVN
jgi:hypothetical protein